MKDWLKGCWSTPALCQGQTRSQIPTWQSPGSPCEHKHSCARRKLDEL